MPSTKRKLQLLGGFTVLVLLAVAVGCKGFFQNPVLQTLTVGPQNPNIQQGTTLQMTATGTYDDGSIQTLTKGVYWSSTDINVAPISTSGVITAASSGTASITASSGAVSGTTNVTVTLANVTGITLSTTSLTIQPGGTGNISCTATVSGGPPVDVTDTVTWTITDSTGATASNITISTQATPAVITVFINATPGTYTVTATYSGTTIYTAKATLNVP